MPIGRRIPHREQFLLNLGEVIRHERTKIRQRTTGEQERDGKNFTFKLRGVDWGPGLVDLVDFGQRVTQLEFLNVWMHSEVTYRLGRVAVRAYSRVGAA